MQTALTRRYIVLLMFAGAFLIAGNTPAQTVLPFSTAKHVFSDPKTLDVFKLTLRGMSLLKSEATLEIFDHNNKNIYREKFPSTCLLNSLEIDALNMTIKQQEEYIRKRVREYFAEDNFSNASSDLSPQYAYDESPSKEIWAEFRADKTAIGFATLCDYEAMKKIAWSRKSKKVVKYWFCC